MTVTLMCGTAFGTFLSGTILPIVAAATFTTMMLIAVTFMIGRALANPKLTLWAKTELVQLGVSLASVGVIVLTVNLFCSMDMAEIATMFSVTGAPTTSINIYDAATTYLNETLRYTHNAVIVIRYHLETYMVLTYFSAFTCDFAVGNIGLGCFFGYSGTQGQPFGGYSAQLATMNTFFTSTLIAYFSTLNSLFILLFVYRGFVFLFLPLGIFLRSMPYLRGFGSLLIALAMSFLTIYPFMLGVLYLMGGVLVDRPNYVPAGLTMSAYDEAVFPDKEGAGTGLASSVRGASYVKELYFGPLGVKEKLGETVAFAAYAFLAGVFFPSIVLLATIASVSYMTRLMGEEIDLSRLTQLV